MRTKYLRVVEKPVTLAAGSILVLSPEQARRRGAAVEPDGKGGYTLVAEQTFKAGEVFGVVGEAEVAKYAAPFVEDARKAEFDAYGRDLAESRRAAHAGGTRGAAAPQVAPPRGAPPPQDPPPPAGDGGGEGAPAGGDDVPPGSAS